MFGVRGEAFSTWSYSLVKLNARIIEAQGKPFPAWRLHDLRRTMRSDLGRLGIPPHVAELAINHVKGGVEGIYDRHKYRPRSAARWRCGPIMWRPSSRVDRLTFACCILLR